MKKVLWVFVLCIFLTGCGKPTLTNLVEKDKSIKNMYYEIEAINHDKNAKTTGKIWIKDDKIKHELDISGLKTTILIDKSKMDYLSYGESLPNATRQKLDDEILIKSNPFGLVESLSNYELDKFKILDSKKFNGNECYVFESGFIESTVSSEKVKYKVYIQKDIEAFVKMEISTKDNLLKTIQISNVIKGDVKDEDVVFSIPEGIEIFDF